MSNIPTLKKLVYKPKTYNYTEERKQQLLDEINKNIDIMYELFPYHSLVCSSKSLLRIRCSDYLYSKKDNDNLVKIYTPYGKCKFLIDEALPSSAYLVYKKSLDELFISNIINEDIFNKYECKFKRTYFTSICINYFKSSVEIAKIKAELEEKIYNEVNEIKNLNNDELYALRQLLSIHCYISKQKEYLNSYKIARETFINLYNETGITDYVYRNISLRQIPKHAIRYTIRDVISNYDKVYNTKIINNFDVLVKKYSKERDEETFLSSGKRKIFLRYFVDDTDYSIQNDEEEEDIVDT